MLSHSASGAVYYSGSVLKHSVMKDSSSFESDISLSKGTGISSLSGHSNKMLCFWLSGFFNSNAGGRVIIIIIMGGCGLRDYIDKSRDLRVFNSNNIYLKS